MLFQTRIHGRGGQGVVSAAEMLSVAAFLEGKHAQAFPSFGSERMGAPVMAFCRIDSRNPPARAGDETGCADYPRPHLAASSRLVFRRVAGWLYPDQFDPELRRTRHRRFARATAPNGYARYRPPNWLLKHVGRAVPNAALLGGFAAISGIVKLESVCAAILDKFSGKNRPTPISPPRGEAYLLVQEQTEGGTPMLKQVEGSQPMAEAIALCRPEVICAYPITPQTHIVEGSGRDGQTRRTASTASSSTSSRIRRAVASPSALRPPERAPIPPPPARDCCSWPKRCTTPPASACPS